MIRITFSGGLLASISLGFWAMGPAFQNSPDADAKALATPVRLTKGAATMAELCAEISTQIGITIDPAEYLRERRFTAELDGLTARAAIEAICDLNDWSLEQVRPGRYMVIRRRLLVAPDPSAMTRAMRAALPRDFRTFLGIEPLPGSGETGPSPAIGVTNAAPHMNRAQAALAASSKMSQNPLEDMPFGSLLPAQKNELVAALTLRLFSFGGDWTAVLWQGEGGFHLADSKIYIEMPQGAGQGGGELLGVRAEDGKGGSVGFGFNVARFLTGGP